MKNWKTLGLMILAAPTMLLATQRVSAQTKTSAKMPAPIDYSKISKDKYRHNAEVSLAPLQDAVYRPDSAKIHDAGGFNNFYARIEGDGKNQQPLTAVFTAESVKEFTKDNRKFKQSVQHINSLEDENRNGLFNDDNQKPVKGFTIRDQVVTDVYGNGYGSFSTVTIEQNRVHVEVGQFVINAGVEKATGSNYMIDATTDEKGVLKMNGKPVEHGDIEGPAKLNVFAEDLVGIEFKEVKALNTTGHLLEKWQKPILEAKLDISGQAEGPAGEQAKPAAKKTTQKNKL